VRSAAPTGTDAKGERRGTRMDGHEDGCAAGRALPRRVLLRASGLATVGISALALPTALAAASTTIEVDPIEVEGTPGGTFDVSRRIPFMPQGDSRLVAGVTVTATTNSATDGGDGKYLHQSITKRETFFTFSSDQTGIQVRTSAHADAGEPNFERYEFEWLLDGVSRASAAIENSDETREYTVAGGFDEMRIRYLFPDGATENMLGSFIEFSVL
jgi:hypothetical protein